MNKKNNNLNYLIKTKEYIYGDNDSCYADSQNNTSPDKYLVDVFEYNNLVQEYNFSTKETAIYLKNDSDKYRLLCEASKSSNIESSFIYTSKYAYLFTRPIAKKEKPFDIDAMYLDDYLYFISRFGSEYIFKLFNTIENFSSIMYMSSHSSRLLNNGVDTGNKSNIGSLPEAKHDLVKFKSASAFIPAYNIITYFIDDIHLYISTQKFDIEVFKRRLLELNDFKASCPTSFSNMLSFVKNPKGTDLRQLCDVLQASLNNIENLLSIYLDTELSLEEKGDRNDCK